ncbi:tripartite tricarboxylate transporter permease [Mycobacterium sp. NAZ190054]|uniref:tripartite tricarboxylate transporter permease n=1 Tax=Mycobacterium sp. NAZ190054 TaxID=1747766 RepID=UPI000A866387|nr:tripartite tricarboxylate transporter permease [Mycobacterium sp. NAZ190054]
MNELLVGFSTALTFENVLVCLVGALLGTLLGILPGIGSSSGMALLIPLTLTMDPLQALILLAALYYGCEYGGTVSSVLLNTPGDGAALVTCIDGHPMAKRGEAAKALAVAAVSSFVAGTLTVVLLSVAAPLFADVALNFGPPEMFALIVLGLTTVGGIAGNARRKGWTMAALGVLVACVGVEGQTGVLRFTFGSDLLANGIGLVPFIIGLVAMAELCRQSYENKLRPNRIARTRYRDMLLTRRELGRIRGSIARGGVLGFLLGCLPGAGPTVATFICYDVEKRVARDKSMFGKGDMRGVASPEAANNAAVNGSFVPTLSLGIPGSGTTAILLGAFVAFGIRPGPLLFEQQGDLVWALIASFYIGNVILVILNLPLAPLFAKILYIPFKYIYPVVLPVALVGAYAVHNSYRDAWIALFFAAVAVLLIRQGYPPAPAILGIVLGPMLESYLERSVSMGAGSFGIFLDRPIALVIFALTILIFVVPVLLRRRRPEPAPASTP